MNKIVYNAIRTPDGTVLESRHRHDYVSYLDKNGLWYMVDGGLEYLKRSNNPIHPHEELSLYNTDPHELIRERFTWGTYGRHGKKPIKYVKLKDMESNHLQAILDTQKHVPVYIRNLFINELKWREDGN